MLEKSEPEVVPVMKLEKIVILFSLVAVCLGTLAAAPQSTEEPIVSSTGRFGDATGTAIMYRDYLYGVIKELKPDEIILTKTKFGVDQAFKLKKKTKFVLDGKASTFDKLKVGDKIYIDVDTDKRTGVMTAKKVVDGVAITSLPTSDQ
jgi:hypothetical protein